MARREVLPINMGSTPVLPGQTALIEARPQRGAFRPERFFVSGGTPELAVSWWQRISPWYRAPVLHGAADWLINDIQIGNRSQFAQSGDLPGDMFATGAIDCAVSFDTVELAMAVKVVVTYIGAAKKGAVFYGSLLGTEVIREGK